MATLQTYSDRTDGPGAWGDITYKARRTFTMKLATGGDEAEQLRAEVTRLNRLLLDQAIEQDVVSGRVLPRDRQLFMRRAGDAATLADWRLFRDGTPRPTMSATRQPMAARATRATVSEPDGEVVERAKELMSKDARLDYSQAMLKVLRDDSELAERYRHAPGVRD